MTNVCPDCGHDLPTKIEKSFFGFGKVQCRHCSYKKTLPLSNTYRTVYWLIVVAGLALLASGLYISITALLAAWALYSDYTITKSLKGQEP